MSLDILFLMFDSLKNDLFSASTGDGFCKNELELN